MVASAKNGVFVVSKEPFQGFEIAWPPLEMMVFKNFDRKLQKGWLLFLCVFLHLYTASHQTVFFFD